MCVCCQVCSQLVRPLLLMSRLLQRQVGQLGDLLVRKDMEIQDYRENGAVLSRGTHTHTHTYPIHVSPIHTKSNHILILFLL